jgi:hypothetical protein
MHAEISETDIRRVVTVADRVRSLIFQYATCCGQIGTRTDYYFSKYFDRSLSESFNITIFHSCTTDAK